MTLSELEKKFIAARQKAIACDFDRLNDVQLNAALTTQGPLLLLAGAGSGKTTVLINRIANLLKYGCGSDSEYVPPDISEEDVSFLETYVASRSREGIRNSEFGIWNDSMNDARMRVLDLCAVDPVEPWRIIAITFTNKAAGEMKHRLEAMLGSSAGDIWAMTFHSACSRILRRDIDKLGYERSFTIYDTSDTSALMKRIMKDLAIEERDLHHKSILGYISRAKDAMTTSYEFFAEAEKANDFRRKMIARAYTEYEERMRASNALDFDDLILLTVRLFGEHPDILQHYQKRFKYVLVDEYQDTNNLQYLLASALADGHGNICVVGDDDQSIYKFRGATIANIMSFESHFKGARVIRLEQNYRSTGYILNAANDVIRNNVGRKGKTLWTENSPGIKPQMHVVDDERDEALFVADKVVTSMAEGRNWSDHAILYRMNAQSNQFETALKRAGVPYRVIGGTGFYERAEIKDMLAYLCVIQNPRDDVRILRIINDPPRGIGGTTIGRLTQLALETERPVFDIVRDAHKHESLKSASARLHSFADMIDDLRDLADSLPLDELYDVLLNRTGYIKMLEEKDLIENISRIENVRELKTNIISFINENGGTLFDFLSETALYTDNDRDDYDSDRVNLMTMHSAKGLEFDTVFLVGAEEGVFPGIRAMGDPTEIEEERRLCYVAMTRAMRSLYLISAKQRMLFGKTSSAKPSRFVREIDTDNLEIHDPRGFLNRLDDDKPDNFSYEPADDFTAYRTPPPSARKPKKTNVSLHSEFRIPNSEFKKGDMIEHTAFGRGLITGMEFGGGDALVEIAFDEVGTKRFMLGTTARYLSIVKSAEN